MNEARKIYVPLFSRCSYISYEIHENKNFFVFSLVHDNIIHNNDDDFMDIILKHDYNLHFKGVSYFSKGEEETYGVLLNYVCTYISKDMTHAVSKKTGILERSGNYY